MRHLISILLVTVMISGSVNAGNISSGAADEGSSVSSQNETVKIISSPELRMLVDKWITGFNQTNPLVNFSVSDLSAEGMAEPGSLYFLTDYESDKLANQLSWQLIIGHNSIVPVISKKNSKLSEIIKRGITPIEFSKILTTGLSWSDLISDGNKGNIKVYINDKPDIKVSLARFADCELNGINVITLSGSSQLVPLIESDPDVIGFCHLSEIKDDSLNMLSGNLIMLPIDKNMNGRIDNFENIYGNPEELSRGLWIGKYPRSLSGNIYLMTDTRPKDNNEVAFVDWIMSDGGKFFAENGFTELVNTEKETALASLKVVPASTSVVYGKTTANIWITILLCTVVAFVLIILVLRSPRKINQPAGMPENTHKGLNPGMVIAPGGLYYDKSHTWTFMEKDGLIRMGIDDFMQHITGDISKIILKEPGTVVRRGEQILSLIKDGKQLSLYAPVSGVIKSLNTNLYLDSSIINTSPYSDGWVYLIEPRNWAREIQLMFMADSYKQWIVTEFTRLKEFFVQFLKPVAVPGLAIIQDGGEISDHLLANLEPEVWEEFQEHFIDIAK